MTWQYYRSFVGLCCFFAFVIFFPFDHYIQSIVKLDGVKSDAKILVGSTKVESTLAPAQSVNTTPMSTETTPTPRPKPSNTTTSKTHEIIATYPTSGARENNTGLYVPGSNDTQRIYIHKSPADVTPTLTPTLSVPKPIRGTGVNKKGFYVPGRLDRSGMVIYHMLQAHSYAYQNNLTFLGACFEGIGQHGGPTPTAYEPSLVALHKKLVAAMGLQDILPFACPPFSSIMVTAMNITKFLSTTNATKQQDQHQDLMFEETKAGGSPQKTMTPAWLKEIRSISRLKERSSSNNDNTSTDCLQVAVHVRRGDAHPCMKYEHYLPSLYYQDALHSYIPKLVQKYQQQQQLRQKQNHEQQNTSATTPVRAVCVTFYSETFTFEPWDKSWEQNWGNLTNNGIEVTTKMEMEADEVELWKRFVSADLVILSKSTFLILPPLLNSFGVIVASPFGPFYTFVKIYSHWEMMDRTILLRAEEKMRTFREQNNCSSPDVRESNEIGLAWTDLYLNFSASQRANFLK